MKLDAARLCLDCDEIHEDQICPACSSEAFAFVTRWVKTSAEQRVERRAAPVVQPATARTPEQIDAYRQLIEGKPDKPAGRGLLTTGVVGLAAVSLLGWAWRAARKGAVPGAGLQVPRWVPGSHGTGSKHAPEDPAAPGREPQS